MTGDLSTRQLDGVSLAVITNRFEAVVRAMANTLLRTGRSGVLKIARDLSCCVLTESDHLLAWAESLPIHLMSGPDLMARTMKGFYPTLKPGDAFFHNSPYHGNSHAADHCILIPVVDRDGIHRFTVVAKAHQADCGNGVPTTYAAAARDVYEEGALIFPCVRVQENYRDVEDFARTCRVRIRVPDQWWGDYLALLGAARIGERRILELGEELGWPLLEAYVAEWFNYSERQMVARIEQLPAGEITVQSAHDPFPGVPDGIPVNARVTVDSERARIRVDMRENVDCQPCGLNLTEATARTAAMLGVFNAIGREVPANAGSFRRLEVCLRENCAVGIPRHPASCSVATTNLADRVTNAVQRALAELKEGIGLAEAGLCQPPAFAVISGLDPRRADEPFVNQLILPSVTGGAAGPDADGWLTLGHVGNAGMMFRDSVELDELEFPIRILEQRIIPDTEGAGRFRGAPGALVEYGPVGCRIEVVYVSDGTVNPALGTRGGLAGATARQYKRTSAGHLADLPPCARVELEAGETIISMSCGGGGYGRPEERPVDQVRRDVIEGWISQGRAHRIYRVLIDDSMEIDIEGTRELRA